MDGYTITLPSDAHWREFVAASQYLRELADIAGSKEQEALELGSCGVIAPEDNPATGAEAQAVQGLRNVIAADTHPTPEQAFGGAAVPVPPPLPTPAPASAVVVPLPTVPAVPPASGTIPPPPANPVPAPYIAPAAAVPGGAAAHSNPVPAGSGVGPGGVELDTRGLPWSGEIHAANRAKTKGGEWVKKRGLNDGAFIARKEAELRAAQAAPAAGAIPLPPAAVSVPLPPAAAAVPLPTATPPSSVPPVGTASGASPASFSELMVALAPHLSTGRVPQALIGEACASVGMPSLPVLSTRPDLVPACWAFIRERAQL